MDWYIYAILSAITAGLYHFISKIAAEKKNNSSEVNFFGMVFAGAITLIIVLYNRDFSNAILSMFLGGLGGLLYAVSSISRFDALKNIHTTLYYPIYKIGVAALVFFITLLIFHESFTIVQIIGVILGLSVFLMLIDRKDEKKRQKNLKKGYILLFIGIVFTAATTIIDKTASIGNINLSLFFFSSYAISAVYSYYSYYRTKNIDDSKVSVKTYGLVYGVLMVVTYYFFLKSLEEGNLMIAYTINSFSILIPMLLSVKIYKDHLDYRKSIVIVVAIISVVLLK